MVRATSSNVLRRITTLLIICCLLKVGLCVNTAAALPGSGTQQDPWRIESLPDFDEFAADPNYWAGFTRLETDVNLAGRTYTTAVIAPDTGSSYGFQGTAFTGVFDGNDHKIIGLTIEGGGASFYCLGFFGGIDDGQVRNLGLEGGSVSGTGSYSYYVGVLVGVNSYGSIQTCYSTGDVNGVFSVGGLVGGNYGSVANCYSTGHVSGSEGPELGGVGGLVGANGSVGGVPSVPGYINNSYSTGNVSGVEKVGGLVGGNYGSVANCYSTGHVSGSTVVGGLVGVNGVPFWVHGYIINSYSTGDVNGIDNVGGLVGENTPGGVERSFWDLETSGEPNMCGNRWTDPNCGKTTAEMQTKSTFTDAGWDFVDIWLINEGATYPVLRQEIRSDLSGDGGVDLLDFAAFADHWLEGKDE